MSGDLLPLHRLSFAVPPTPSPDLGVMGKMEWVDLDLLMVDQRYQRPILAKGRKNIERIVAGFSWSLFSPLVVAARPEGKYAIIDGQHRATAAKTHGGIKQVPCLIIDGDESVEARAFALINGQVTAVTSNHIYYARMHGKEPAAVALSEVCAAAMVRVLRTPAPYNFMKPGDTLAIGALENSLARYGRNTLIAALQTVTQTHDGNPGFLRAPVITGTCTVLAEQPKWVEAGERLFTAVEVIGVPAMFQKANEMRLAKMGTVVTNYGSVLRDHLTKHLGVK